MSISLSGVGHTYGATVVLRDLDLQLQQGELLCVLGPSGSGKSTLLKLLAGLEPLQTGTLKLGGQVITRDNCPPPENRAIGLVFQEHALFPHLSVEQNLAFGLSDLSDQERSQRVEGLLTKTELDDLRSRLPSMLSGGQQQRVALARALAPQPEVLLLDEPFASVDVLLKARLREEMRSMLKELGSTSILVTHDPEDALMLADRVAVIVAGQLVQIGTPRQLWESPKHPFVAEVFAKQQLVQAQFDGETLSTVFGNVDCDSTDHLTKGTVTLSLNPFDLKLSPHSGSGVQVVDIRFAGQFYQVYLQSGAEQLVALSMEPPDVQTAQEVSVSIASQSVRAYNRE